MKRIHRLLRWIVLRDIFREALADGKLHIVKKYNRKPKEAQSDKSQQG